MNILILSWRGPGHPLAGGAEISTHEHAKGWVKAGNNVTLFTSAFSGGKTEEIINGVKIIRRGSDIFGVRVSAFFWYFFGRHSKYDLVVDEFHGIPFFTPLFIGVKKIGWIHEVAKEVWWLNPWPKPLNLIPGLMGTLFEPLIFKLVYRNVQFMTVSESTKADLIIWDIHPNKIKVIHNGFNPISVRAKKNTKKTAIFLGALAKDKGTEDAIKTFGLINVAESNWQFWVVGWGERNYLYQLKLLTKKLGIEKKTKFWGFVDEKTKFELLSRAHIFINPSVREGWGLVNIEANSVGTPVVGYDVPGIRDSVVNGTTGVLTKFGDYKGLADEAIRLCNNSRLYNQISTKAILWAKKFTWKKSASESLQLINKIINS